MSSIHNATKAIENIITHGIFYSPDYLKTSPANPPPSYFSRALKGLSLEFMGNL